MSAADEPLATQTPAEGGYEEKWLCCLRRNAEIAKYNIEQTKAVVELSDLLNKTREESTLKTAELEEMLGAALAKIDAKDAEIAELTQVLTDSKKKNAKDLAEIRSFIFRTKHVMDQMEEKRVAIYKMAAALEDDEIPKKITFV